MKIGEIGNKPCQIGRSSITVKDPETGKTCGVVRNVLVLEHEKQARNLFDFHCRHKNCKTDVIRRSVVVDGEDYFIVNAKRMRHLEKFAKDFEADAEHLRAENEAIEAARECGVQILCLELI